MFIEGDNMLAENQRNNHFVLDKNISIDKFASICKEKINAKEYSFNHSIEKNVIIYNGEKILKDIKDNPEKMLKYKNELHFALFSGPGVIVIKNMFLDLSIIDKQSEIFYKIAEKEKEKEESDHFAAKSNNLRIWNSLNKSALEDPVSFVDYYSNSLLKIVCESWLGPFYQMTAQVNIVRPGSQAQAPHRDYHFGFQSNEIIEQFPVNIQRMSQFLTLQGAIAHSDMAIESGPTLLLPFSQKYDLGYLSWRNESFVKFFQENAVQLPLKKGDGLFFNPALFHGAGKNITESKDRIANLLQISSCFGKTMESLDHLSMITKLYPILLEKYQSQVMNEEELKNVCICISDGYSFPTNLDIDLPKEGLAPETIFQLTVKSVKEGLKMKEFIHLVKEKYSKRQVI